MRPLPGLILAAMLIPAPSLDRPLAADTAREPSNGPAAAVPDEDHRRSLAMLSLELVNRERAAIGLPALVLDPIAGQAAGRHATDMLARGYYAHRSPEGDSVLDRIIASGGDPWLRAAENIAECSNCPEVPGPALVERLHRRWMESPGHRKNILAEGMTRFGFGMASGPPRLAYAVQAFAGPGPDPTTAGRPPRRLAPDAQLAMALHLLNRRRSELDRPGLETDRSLLSAVRALLAGFDADPRQDLDRLSARAVFDRLSEPEQARWDQLEILVQACGGCGAKPTDGDVARFIGGWLEKPDTRGRLISAAASHYAFALWSGGGGRKIALSVIGRRR